MSQHYVHDMWEWFGNEVLPDGSFAYDLERWWREREVYLATAADALVGFAVIGNAQQWTGNPAAHDVAEFFVLRKYRRQGVGNSLAQLCGINTPANGWCECWLRTCRPSPSGVGPSRSAMRRIRSSS